MGSSYYSPGEEEQNKALQSMLAWAQHQKSEGKNFFGQELKVDPSKGKGAAAQATVTNAKQMPRHTPAMGRGIQAHQRLSQDLAQPAINAAKEVGALTTMTAEKALSTVNPGAKGMGLTTKLGAGKDLTITGLDAASKAKNAMAIKDAATLSQASTMSAIQSAASSAMPWLLGLQLAAGFLGARGDSPGQLAGGSGKHKEEELDPGLVGW